jgi:hypothetical protein
MEFQFEQSDKERDKSARNVKITMDVDSHEGAEEKRRFSRAGARKTNKQEKRARKMVTGNGMS